MKELYKQQILDLVDDCTDIDLLDLVYKLLISESKDLADVVVLQFTREEVMAA